MQAVEAVIQIDKRQAPSMLNLTQEEGMADFEDRPYYWAVMCKNHWFHRRKNLLYGHTIPLAETDFCSPPPSFDYRFSVQCDECGKEYVYDPREILRAEMEPVAPIVPHHLFR